MITKNFLLAAGAIFFGIGSSFASLFLLEDTIVKVKMTNSPSAPIVCINTGFHCDSSIANICQVIVATQQGDQLATTTSASARTYRTDCTELLGNTILAPGPRFVPPNLPYTLVK